MKNEIMREIDKLAESIREKSDSAARDLAAVRETILSGYVAWEERLNSINERRDDLDAEEREVTRENAKLMQQATDRLLTIIQSINGTAPAVASLPKFPSSSMADNVRDLLSNKKQASGGGE